MFSLKDTVTSGQCFRFSEKDGVFTVLSGVGSDVRCISVSQDDLSVLERDPYWRFFFDLDADYESMMQTFRHTSEVMEKACEYAPGIRILNQDSWEALCSFVVSQNNNIKRIMGIIDRMCTAFGERNSDGVYGFPTPQALSCASLEDLRKTGLGFRAPYIHNVATSVSSGETDLESIRNMDIEDARKALMRIRGIGPKVANCALLFGFHRLDCFPLDTWMIKVMDKYFDSDDGTVLGPYRGLAQQYLFHWARTGEGLDDI